MSHRGCHDSNRREVTLRIGRQSMPALPLFLDVDLLGHRERVVDLDPEITRSALDLRMA